MFFLKKNSKINLISLGISVNENFATQKQTKRYKFIQKFKWLHKYINTKLIPVYTQIFFNKHGTLT